MRDYKIEFEKRVAFIKNILADSGSKGIVFGNSGGKDSALVGILCKAACDNTVGIILPCTSKRNYDEDTADAKSVAEKAEQGFKDAAEVYSDCGKMLGRGLSILIDLLNPEKIVIGSIFMRAEKLLRDEIKGLKDIVRAQSLLSAETTASNTVSTDNDKAIASIISPETFRNERK